MKWQETEFENLYLIPSKNGLTRPSAVRGAGYKFINMGEIFAHNRIGSIDMERVQMNEKELDSMLVEEGDLLFARQSLVLAGAGKCSIIQEIDEPTTFESHIIRVRLRKDIIDPRFYYYYFKSPICKIKSIVTQGVQAGIRGNDLKKLKVHIPSLEIQEKIADILSKYDDLIENNRRRIELLEESARLLYREWFVYLRFPGHEHTPIIDGIPEGWERIKLKCIANINASSLTSKFQGEIQYVDISSVTNCSINTTTKYDFQEAPSRAKRIVKHGDIIWSCVRPNLKSHTIIWNPPENLIVSTGFAVITPSQVPTSFLYQALTTPEFVGYLSQNARGTSYPAVTASDFENTNIIYPNASLIKAFDDVIKPTITQINTLQQQIIKLAEARDLLLPRLMNGEIAV